jgi:hypothetical protein
MHRRKLCLALGRYHRFEHRVLRIRTPISHHNAVVYSLHRREQSDKSERRRAAFGCWSWDWEVGGSYYERKGSTTAASGIERRAPHGCRMNETEVFA